MQTVSTFKRVIQLIFLILLVNVVGYIASGYMTPDTMMWYNSLPMSQLTPPAKIFGLVWGILLLLQAIAAFIVWNKASPRYFVIQLALNMLWSFVFFYLKNPIGAFAVTIFFILALMMNIKVFAKASKLAGWLIVPTLVWAIFALYLNAVIVF